MTTGADPAILTRVRSDLSTMYGERLDQVFLYGSRARGDASDDSDYDVAVFISPLGDRWGELDRLAEMTVRWFDETAAYIDARPYHAQRFQEISPLMQEIRLDGIAL
jgi:uncharacterized protein